MQLRYYWKYGVHKNCSCFLNCFTVGMFLVTDIDLSLLVRGELNHYFGNVNFTKCRCIFLLWSIDARWFRTFSSDLSISILRVCDYLLNGL